MPPVFRHDKAKQDQRHSRKCIPLMHFGGKHKGHKRHKRAGKIIFRLFFTAEKQIRSHRYNPNKHNITDYRCYRIQFRPVLPERPPDIKGINRSIGVGGQRVYILADHIIQAKGQRQYNIH